MTGTIANNLGVKYLQMARDTMWRNRHRGTVVEPSPGSYESDPLSYAKITPHVMPIVGENFAWDQATVDGMLVRLVPADTEGVHTGYFKRTRAKRDFNYILEPNILRVVQPSEPVAPANTVTTNAAIERSALQGWRTVAFVLLAIGVFVAWQSLPANFGANLFGDSDARDRFINGLVAAFFIMWVSLSIITSVLCAIASYGRKSDVRAPSITLKFDSDTPAEMKVNLDATFKLTSEQVAKTVTHMGDRLLFKMIAAFFVGPLTVATSLAVAVFKSEWEIFGASRWVVFFAMAASLAVIEVFAILDMRAKSTYGEREALKDLHVVLPLDGDLAGIRRPANNYSKNVFDEMDETA